MGHTICAFADKKRQTEIALLRLFPREGFAHGNIYDVLEAQDLRGSCSGTGLIGEFKLTRGCAYPVEPNKDSESFLDKIHLYLEAHPEISIVYIKFE